MSGPNDFTGVVINGVWTAQPGLGEFEPSPTTTLEVAARVADITAREEALRVKADQLAAREAALAAFEPPKAKK